MRTRGCIALGTLIGLAGLAMGQNLVIYDVDKTFSVGNSYRPT